MSIYTRRNLATLIATSIMWCASACGTSSNDDGTESAADGGGGQGVDPGDGGMGGETPDVGAPEVAGWQVLELSGLGRIRDVVAVHTGEEPVVALATETGLFKLSAAGVEPFDVPRIAGGYVAVDFTPNLGLMALAADGVTLVTGPAEGPLQTVMFGESQAWVEIVASPSGYIGFRSTDSVVVYEKQESGAFRGIAGYGGPFTTLVPEGPQHVAADDQQVYLFDQSEIAPLTLDETSSLAGVMTLHLDADGDIVGGDTAGRIIERTDGIWRRLEGPAPSALRGGDVGPASVLLVGDSGLVVERTGGRWTRIELPRTDDLVDVAATPGQPLLLTAAGEVLWYGLPSQAPRSEGEAPQSPDGGMPDAGPPPAAPPQMRVLSMAGGAVLDACLDGVPFGGPYDGVGNQGGAMASPYARISEGPRRFQTDVYFLPDNRCRDIGEDDEFTARPDKLYAGLIWELIGFSSVEVLSANRPPVDGATRVRAIGRSVARSGRLALCVDGQQLPPDFGPIDRDSFSVEVRLQGDPACSGELLGTAPVQLEPGSASTLVGYALSQQDDAGHALLNCVDVRADGTLDDQGRCSEVALTAP